MTKREWVLGILGGLAIVAVVLVMGFVLQQTIISAFGE